MVSSVPSKVENVLEGPVELLLIIHGYNPCCYRARKGNAFKCAYNCSVVKCIAASVNKRFAMRVES